jgi:hypothetical protein
MTSITGSVFRSTGIESRGAASRVVERYAPLAVTNRKVNNLQALKLVLQESSSQTTRKLTQNYSKYVTDVNYDEFPTDVDYLNPSVEEAPKGKKTSK